MSKFNDGRVHFRNSGMKRLRFSYSQRRLQSTLVISMFTGLSEILRDIGTSTYQIYRIEKKKKIIMIKKKINRTTTFHEWICNETIVEKEKLWII